jgi:hypothetical protein
VWSKKTKPRKNIIKGWFPKETQSDNGATSSALAPAEDFGATSSALSSAEDFGATSSAPRI